MPNTTWRVHQLSLEELHKMACTFSWAGKTFMGEHLKKLVGQDMTPDKVAHSDIVEKLKAAVETAGRFPEDVCTRAQL